MALADVLTRLVVIYHYTAARCHTPAAASARQLMPVPPATATLNSGPDTRAQRNHKPGPRHLPRMPGATRAGKTRVPGP